MKTSWQKLSNFLTVEDLSGLKISTAVWIVQRIYCGPMNVRGMCTTLCDNCALPLKRAFDLKEGRNKEALLTWSLKNAIAANQETFFVKDVVIVVKKDKYGLPTPEINPIDKILAELGA
jgi:hypothetical protein